VIAKVRETGADLGIAWDGDADRCFFIDGDGEFVPGDFVTALLAASVLEHKPGADILYDVRASRAVPDTIERLGGRALINRVGHAFFKTRMRRRAASSAAGLGPLLLRLLQRRLGLIPALLILELLSKWLRRAAARAASRATSSARSTPGRRSAPRSSSCCRYGDGVLPSSTACPSTTRTGTSTWPSNTGRCCG
jgi:phosphomannomutase